MAGEIRTRTRAWKIVESEIEEDWRQWVHEPDVKDPVGRRVRGYIVIDVRDQADWDTLLPIVGGPVMMHGVFPDGPRTVRLTDQRLKDVEVVDGRPVTLAVTYGWEAYPDPVEDLPDNRV